MRHLLLSPLFLVLLVSPGCRNEKKDPPAAKEPPAVKGQEPSPAVVAAWHKVGAYYGGMKMRRFGNLSLMPRDGPGAPEPRDRPTPDELPAFGFDETSTQRLAELPAVGAFQPPRHGDAEKSKTGQ